MRAWYPTMSERLPAIKNRIAPTSISSGNGTPTLAITFATSLKFGILFPAALARKMAENIKRPAMVRIPCTVLNMIGLLCKSWKCTCHDDNYVTAPCLAKIKQQDLTRPVRRDLQSWFTLDCGPIASRQRRVIQLNCSA